MEPGSYKIQTKIPADLLSAGVYRIGLILCLNRAPIQELDAVAKFRIYPNDDLAETRGMGSVIRPKLSWDIDYLREE
jgi:hypothetical protein